MEFFAGPHKIKYILELSAFGAKDCGCVGRLRGQASRNCNPFGVFPVKPGQPFNETGT